MVYLHVKAFVKPEVSFESSSLSLDNIINSREVIKEAYLNLAGYKGVTIDSIVTSNPLITAAAGEAPDTMTNDQRIQIDITIAPGLDPGLLSESLIVYFAGDRTPSQLYLYGIVVKDIQVTPLALVYIIPDHESNESWSRSRTLTVTSNLDDSELEILDVSDPAGLLIYTVTEIEPGRKFEIEATLRPITVSDDSALASNVVITTNHATQKTIEIPLRLEHK